MQDIYHRAQAALSAYSRNKDYDFATPTRVPYDSRIPDSFRSKILWESFPDPMLEIVAGFADSSCRVDSCVIDGRQSASNYAKRVYEFMVKSAMFSYEQRSTYLVSWLAHYIPATQLVRIPKPAENYRVAQTLFQNPSASRSPVVMPSPDEAGFMSGGISATAFNWATQIIQAQPSQYPSLFVTEPEDLPAQAETTQRIQPSTLEASFISMKATDWFTTTLGALVIFLLSQKELELESCRLDEILLELREDG